MKCEICGCEDESVLVEHHIVPRSRGGSDDPSNIRILCRNCHARAHYGPRSEKNQLVKLDDGRVEITFPRPISLEDFGIEPAICLGSRKGNKILVKPETEQVEGVRVWPEDWLDLINSLGVSKKAVREFKEAMK